MNGPGRFGDPVLAMICYVLLMVTLTPGASCGADPESRGWSQWRGPTFDGISEESGIAETWPADGPPVIWTREIGSGYSSLIAVGEHVFTQVQTLYEQAVVCLDAETGETVWSSHYGWPYDGGGLYPGPRSTPTWHDGKIYFAAPEGTIGCLNASNGDSLWSVNPKKQFRGKGSDFGYASSPVVVDGKVIIPVGGDGACVVALDAKDGSVVWKGGNSPASYASPLPITLNGRPQIIALLENSLAAFDLKSGKLLWEDDLSQGYDEHSAAPLYREPFLMIAGPFRSGARCLRLTEEDSVKPTVKWETQKFSNDIASSVLLDGRVYGFDLKDPQSRVNRPSRGEYRCVDFETGKVLWSTDKVGHANTIVADGKLILFNDRGEVILARAGTDDYQELARVQVFEDEICWSSPALCRGRLYLRTQSRAACLYIGAGPLRAEQPVQTVAEIPGVQSFDARFLLGGEREYPATTPEWDEFLVWYLWGLAAIGVACVLSGGMRGAMVMCRRTSPQSPMAESVGAIAPSGTSIRWDVAVFWLVVLASGVVGSPLLNGWLEGYVFLWPLVLWACLQLTVLATTWAERQANRNRARWVSRISGLTFLGVNALYFHLCRKLGMSIEWGFLTGLLASFPVAAAVAWEQFRISRVRWLLDGIGVAVSFSAYYWSAAGLIKWWLRIGS